RTVQIRTRHELQRPVRFGLADTGPGQELLPHPHDLDPGQPLDHHSSRAVPSATARMYRTRSPCHSDDSSSQTRNFDSGTSASTSRMSPVSAHLDLRVATLMFSTQSVCIERAFTPV